MSENFSSIYLSVVMPVYNEARTIAESVRRVEAFLSLKNKPWELVIVNDGSRDETSQILKSIVEKRQDARVQVLDLEKNTGKGAAVKKGVLHAQGDYILVTDADLSSPIKEADKLLKALETHFHVAIGSRSSGKTGADVQQSFKRRVAGRFFNGLTRAIVLSGLSDTQCGFKCFKKEPAKKIFAALTLNRFGFDVEALILAKKLGYKVDEIPVMWKQGLYSKVNLFKDSITMVGDLFYLRRKYGYTQ